MGKNKKIVTKDDFRSLIRPSLKENGNEKVIALCHGCFDLVHPGHLNHFLQAKEICDVLVVSVTAAAYVRKGPGRPYFDDETRLNYLASFECIDYVILSESYIVDDIIEAVEPDYYVKGAEYKKEDEDITGMIRVERELVERHGGKLFFTGGDVYSSTKLINTALPGLPDDVRSYMETYVSDHSLEDILEYAEKASKLRALVIGDIIIDRYSYCEIHGLINKDSVYSSRLDNTEDYAGGSAAIARAVSSFASSVVLMGAVGSDDLDREIIDSLPDNCVADLLYSTERPTIVKHKFLTRNSKRDEYRKFFATHNIPKIPIYEDELKRELRVRLRKLLENVDVVFLCDFGHGLLDKDTIKLIQESAPYLILNCQTNSANRGLNIITKYNKADIFCLDQEELQLAYPDLYGDEIGSLKALSRHLGASGFLTQGSNGASSVDLEQNIASCPALTLHVKDTIGAGDAFYSVAGMFMAAGAPSETGLLMGNIGGALAANIVGNKEAVEKVNVLKYASTLMNV